MGVCSFWRQPKNGIAILMLRHFFKNTTSQIQEHWRLRLGVLSDARVRLLWHNGYYNGCLYSHDGYNLVWRISYTHRSNVTLCNQIPEHRGIIRIHFIVCINLLIRCYVSFYDSFFMSRHVNESWYFSKTGRDLKNAAYFQFLMHFTFITFRAYRAYELLSGAYYALNCTLRSIAERSKLLYVI